MMTRRDIARWLAQRDHFAILTHRRPDGDNTGSAAALCMGLRSLGKTAYVVENPEFTPKYAHLLPGLTQEAVAQGDTLISVDVAAPNMLPKAFEKFLERIALRIDHHGSATSFTELELVDPDAAACAEIIYDILMEMGVKLDEKMADALYTGVSTDTGCFRYANTEAHSFTVAAACAAAGGDLKGINLALFETNTLGRLRIQGWIVENARFLADGAIAICSIPKAVEQQLGVTEDDMENISSFPRTIEGVKIAATLREGKDGVIKLSVRAVPGYDAAAVCAQFGGGGHKGAAGGSLHMCLEEAAQAVARAMPEM